MCVSFGFVQTALDLLTTAATAETPVNGGEGTAAGAASDHKEVGAASLLLVLLHQSYTDHIKPSISTTRMLILYTCLYAGGDGGGGAPAGRRGEPAAPADAGRPHPQLQRSVPSAHPSPAAAAAGKLNLPNPCILLPHLIIIIISFAVPCRLFD